MHLGDPLLLLCADVDELMTDEQVGEIVQHPDKIVVELMRLASSNPKLTAAIGARLCEPFLKTWLEKTLKITNVEVVDKIVGVVGPGLQGAQLAPKIVQLAANPSIQDSIAFALMLAKLIAKSSQDLLQHVLQATLRYILESGGGPNANEDPDVIRVVEGLPWSDICAKIGSAMTSKVSITSPQHALGLVANAFTNIDPTISQATWGTIKPVLERKLKEAFSRHFATLGVSPNQSEPVLVELSGVAISQLTRERVVKLLSDPTALSEFFFAVLGRVAKDTATSIVEKVRLIVKLIFVHRLGQNGIKRKKIEEIWQMMETDPDSDIFADLCDPIAFARHLLARLGDDESQDLLQDCARAIIAHALSEQLEHRGFDSRVTWLAQEAVSNLPLENLIAALEDPDQLMRLVLQEMKEGGVDMAHAMLDDATERAREAALAKLVSTGLSEEYAAELVDYAQEQLLDPASMAEALSDIKEVSADELLDQIEKKLTTASGATGLAMMAFFLRGRCLPLYDMVSDLLVILEMRKYLGGTAFLGCPFSVLYYSAVTFFFLTWAVLWIMLGQHATVVALEMRSSAALEKKGKKEITGLRALDFAFDSINTVFDDDFLSGQYRLRDLCIIIFLALPVLVLVELPSMVVQLFVFACSHAWYAFISRACWRCDGYALLPTWGDGEAEAPAFGECSDAAYRLVALVYTVLTLPLGILVLGAYEIGTLVFLPHRPAQGSLASNYENLKRVLEPLLEALPQAVVQTIYMFWKLARGHGSFDPLILSSVVASVTQMCDVVCALVLLVVR